MFCKKCGAELPSDAVFCEKCGAPVSAPAPADAPPAAAPANEPVQNAAFPGGTETPAAGPVPSDIPQGTPAAAPTSSDIPQGTPPASPVSSDIPQGTPYAPAAPAAPKKSKKGLIVGIVAVVVILLIILLAVFGLGGGKNNDGGNDGGGAATAGDDSGANINDDNDGSGFGGFGGGSDPIIGEWELFALIDNNNTDDITAVPSGNGSLICESDYSCTLTITTDSYYGDWEQNPELTDRLDDATGYTIDFDDLPDGSVSLTEISGEDTVLLLIPGIDYGMAFQK